jgi:hypothetical protein
MQSVTLGASGLEVTPLAYGPDDLAEIDRIMAGAVPVGGPSPEGTA